MNGKKLLAYPLIDKLEYRQNIDSDQLNRMFHSIEESILRAIMRGRDAQDLISRLNLAAESSNRSVVAETSRLLAYIRDIYNTMIATGYEDVITPVGYSVNNDKIAGSVTMPYVAGKNLSKIPRYDSDNDGIADTVSPSVKIRVNDVERPPEDSIYNMLNRRNDSFWIEQLGAGTHVIEIELPPSINKKFNYLELIPMPIFGFEITKIEYLDLKSNAQEIIRPGSVRKDGPQILHFAPKQFNNIIKLTINVGDAGVIGFTNVDIALVDYQNTAQMFYIPFTNVPTSTVDSEVNYGNYIKDIRLVSDMTNDTLISVLKPVSEQLLTSITLNGTMYIKVTMQENDLTTPIFYGAKITY
jgi:hypothetical protein